MSGFRDLFYILFNPRGATRSNLLNRKIKKVSSYLRHQFAPCQNVQIRMKPPFKQNIFNDRDRIVRPARQSGSSNTLFLSDFLYLRKYHLKAIICQNIVGN